MTTPEPAARVGGIVLAGGSSERLGRDKATLDWHGTPLVERVARLLARGLGGGPVAVVGPADRTLPGLPAQLQTVSDPEPDGGPLVGLMAGLDLLQGQVEAVVAVPCDLPLLHPALVRTLIEHLLTAGADVACPTADDGRPLPLPGAWGVGSIDAIGSALSTGERSPARVAAQLRLAGVPLTELAADPLMAELDPDLDCLLDIDTDLQVEQLIGRPPKVRLSRDRRLETASAWTLGDLVSQAGDDLDGPCVVNGLPVEFDPRFPLARRDSVSLPPRAPL